MKNLEHKETKETKTTTQPTSTSTENIQNFFPRPGVLDAAGQKVPENAVFDLAVRIKTTNLTSVNFNSSTLTQATLELISTAIFGGNPTITSIDIGNNSNLFNSINADIGNVFVEAVGNQTSLTSINLSSTDLSSTVAHTLAPALSGKPIKYLNLSNNIMQFEVVNFLKAIAPQFLVHLDLSSIEPYNIY